MDEARIAQILRHPLHRAMGLHDLQAEDGRAWFEVQVGADMVNAAGMLHGGIVYTLADLCCLAAVSTQLPADRLAVTHDLHVSLLRAARLGQHARFESQVLKLGATLAFLEARVTCGEALLARVNVTKSILSLPSGASRPEAPVQSSRRSG